MCGRSEARSWRRYGSCEVVNVVCVESGVLDSADVEAAAAAAAGFAEEEEDGLVFEDVGGMVVEGTGRGFMPRSCEACECVRNAKGAAGFASASLLCERDGLVGEAEDRGSVFETVVALGEVGWRRARRRAIWASLRVFSAARAAWSFCVSISLRRSA